MDWEIQAAGAPVRYAFDDDESDSEAEVSTTSSNKAVSVDIGLTTPIPSEKCTLVIGLKGPGSLYVKALKNGVSAAGTVSIKTEEKDKPTQTKEHPIFLLSPDVLGVSFQDVVENDQVYAVVKPIFELVGDRVKSVVVLDALPSAEYLHTGDRDDLLPPCLRILQSSAASSVPGLESLEVPNMLKGLSAAFTSLCEVRNVPCYTLVTMQEYYLGKPIVTLETVEAYIPALKKIGLDKLVYQTADMQALLKTEQSGAVNRLYL
ncbi:hypothetical protein BDB00DRAFT_874987 [Zychaea mexicana]|uniref:uncharacterized protein n=1 Tax=Zychaea mexicana TaxID=64656 RepID=UPI0022FE176B|nr:uncharacterized protein BDB00DRAFT_874987 [Zychaea mexicana]KAI9490818.1 hypothetical protein BDB00DRAFT_874987 [Zychaea mexicana]